MLLASAWRRSSWRRQPAEEPLCGGALSGLRTGGGQSTVAWALAPPFTQAAWDCKELQLFGRQFYVLGTDLSVPQGQLK